jgi:hypothetical protein
MVFSGNKRFFILKKCISAILIIFFLSACGVSTPAPPFLHYKPSKSSNIHIEFDYPSTWLFSEEIEYTDFIVISMGDPRISTVPTRAPNESHGTPSDLGRIVIDIQPVKSGQTLDTLFSEYTQDDEYNWWIKPIDHYKVKMDGHDAFILELQIEPLTSIDGNGFTSQMFSKYIVFIVNNQIYRINFTVAEKERGGEFEQGFDYFFNSLKIVP